MKVQPVPLTRSQSRLNPHKKTLETDIESTCSKPTPKKSLRSPKQKPIKKNTQILKSKQKPVFHEKIFRFRLKNTRKTMRIYLFKQCDMKWPKKFTKQLCPQEMDNDLESDSELIEEQVEKCRDNFLRQVQSRGLLKGGCA